MVYISKGYKWIYLQTLLWIQTGESKPLIALNFQDYLQVLTIYKAIIFKSQF